MLARFFGQAKFFQTTFNGAADFSFSAFAETVDFSNSVFVKGVANPAPWPRSDTNIYRVFPVADFRCANFSSPDQVKFFRINTKESQGVRVRLLNCNVKNVSFAVVNWHRENGRIVLQDEIDVRRDSSEFKTYGQVAIAYRQLINNFEESRDYDLAEDCCIGVMEMKRLDPTRPAFSRIMVALYRFFSFYGSSYTRALVVLLAAVFLVFPLLFSLAELTPNISRRIQSLYPVGLVHSVEVGIFQSNTHYLATTTAAWGLEIIERIFVPAQVALFLLALRRRFRR